MFHMNNTIDRRSFIGGLVSAAALPVLAADDPALFPGRGTFERIMLASQHVHIGLEKPFSVLHISDTHLTECNSGEPPELMQFAERRRRTFGGRQEEALRDSLAWAKKNVDYVVHTGDLIDFITDANLALVRKYYGEAAGAMIGSTGNHEYQRRLKGDKIESSPAYNELSRARLETAYPYDVKFSSTVLNGVNFITIEQVYGTVLPEQVERFHAEAKKGLPMVLCMHAPFMTEGIWRLNARFWGMPNRKYRGEMPDPRSDYRRQLDDPVTCKFLEYLRGEPLLKAILAGHLHITVQDRFSSTAMQYVVGGNFMFHGEEVLFT